MATRYATLRYICYVMGCILQAWQQQPPPFLQQQRALRRLPTILAEVAQAVQQKVVDTCMLSQHGKGDMQDIQNLMGAALLAVSFSESPFLMSHAHLYCSSCVLLVTVGAGAHMCACCTTGNVDGCCHKVA